jgi:hypothetical protein
MRDRGTHFTEARQSLDDHANFECAANGSHGIRGCVTSSPSVQEHSTMKKNLLFAAVIFTMLAGGTAVYAQMGQEQGGGQWSGHGPGQPMTADQRLQRMTKQLNLTDAQQQQIKPILENESTQMQTLRADSSLSQQDRMDKMMQIRQDTAGQIKPILNADQQKQYEEMMSRQGHGHGPGQIPPQSSGQPPQQ